MDRYRCAGCGELIPADEIDSLRGHTGTGRDNYGRLEQIHCGPVEDVPYSPSEDEKHE